MTFALILLVIGLTLGWKAVGVILLATFLSTFVGFVALMLLAYFVEV